MPREKLSNLFSQETRDLLDRQKASFENRKKDYYSVTPKGFQLSNLLSERMDELDADWKASGEQDRTSTPGWTEYKRLFHSSTMIIRASSPSGLWINPAYEEEESEALEELIEGGYIVRASS